MPRLKKSPNPGMKIAGIKIPKLKKNPESRGFFRDFQDYSIKPEIKNPRDRNSGLGIPKNPILKPTLEIPKV